MRYRQLGSTGLKLSEIGIGGSHFGSMSKQSDPKAIERMLRQALDSGVNFFDTADIYGQGESERIIGRTFAACRDRAIIATKAGFCLSDSGKLAARLKPLIKPLLGAVKPLRRSVVQARGSQIQQDFSGDYLVQSVERSLKRLRTDYIDLFQLHEPPAEAILDESVLAALERLKKQGKIRFYGVACRCLDDALLALEHAGYASVQVEFNLHNQAAAVLLPRAQVQGVGVMARQPFASGRLFEQLKDSAIDVETTGAEITEERLIRAAFQSVLRFEGVTTVITGMRSRAHLSHNLGALDNPLLDGELSELEAALAAVEEGVAC